MPKRKKIHPSSIKIYGPAPRTIIIGVAVMVIAGFSIFGTGQLRGSRAASPENTVVVSHNPATASASHVTYWALSGLLVVCIIGLIMLLWLHRRSKS